MAIFKCKMCGGTLEINQGESVGVCEYCGTKQTLPKLDDDRKVNLYDRANHFRRNNDYDKAMGIYEQILSEDNTDAEAYWSLVLCKYGIEYVEDPATHKRIPTVNRAQYTSIFADEDYKSAIQYADAYQKSIYEAEAKAIDEIQKGILEISQKEEPFDIFICYKETGADGRRTPDSVLATELYHELTREGFKVFFSRITLEDKLGTAYEPYIFAALNSAKVMVVLGTRAEYFNAVWVKNEWSRFLALIKNGKRKTLIPAYRDMDPYDLPEEFSHLQAQDMSKLGFMSDLVRGINKILSSSKEQPKETVVVSSGNAEVEPLLKRVFIFLEDGDWESADQYCERVLDIDPENAQAYLGKLMAEIKIRKQEDFNKCETNFENSVNYQKALKYGNTELKNQMAIYVEAIRENIKNKYYSSLVEKMNASNTEDELLTLAKSFAKIADYKDAKAMSTECIKKAKMVVLKAELQLNAIANAITEKATGKHTLTLQEELQAEQANLRQLELLLQSFDSNMSDYQHLKTENQNNDEKIKQLQTKKSSLGLFAGKEKKEINAKILELTHANESITQKIDGLKLELKGFSTRQEIETSVQRIKTKIAELESKVQEESSLGITHYTYEQAFSVYYTDYNIYTMFSKNYPNLTGYLTTLFFGNYYQSSVNHKESIEWLILEKQENNLLLLSRYALDSQKFNESKRGSTWETCTLRKWLNSTFINNAFNTQEQKAILSTIVKADRNPNYGTDPGNDTKDRVFLLSVIEIKKYFKSKADRKCLTTLYSARHWKRPSVLACDWWSRTPGRYDSYCAGVYSATGDFDNDFIFIKDDTEYVRPAMWISLDELR